MRMVSNTFDPLTFYLILPGVGVGKATEACRGAPVLRGLNMHYGRLRAVRPPVKEDRSSRPPLWEDVPQ